MGPQLSFNSSRSLASGLCLSCRPWPSLNTMRGSGAGKKSLTARQPGLPSCIKWLVPGDESASQLICIPECMKMRTLTTPSLQLIDHQNTFAPIPDTGDSMSSWKQWVDMESRRRLLSGCFILDVHSVIYYEQPPIVILHLDYSSPSTLLIPLASSGNEMWEAEDSTANP